MRRRLKRIEKEMPRAGGRIASERVADFSQVLRPRVAARRRPTPSRHEQGLGRARRDASPTAVYVTGAYGPVAHAQACARCVRRRRKR